MKKVKVSDYYGEEMGTSLFSILIAIGSGHATEEVEIDRWEQVEVFGRGKKTSWMENRDVDLKDKNGYPLVGPTAYKSWWDITGAMLLSDNRVIMALSSKEGSDSFQSGENVVRYYILTPTVK